MLRKFLIPTVIVSILLLLTTLAFITITEATSVTTSRKTAPKTKTDTKTTSTEKATTSKTSATALKEFKETSAVSKFLNNVEETTTSLLPLQPPLNVTSTTLASFILNQKHRQQQWQQQKQRQHKQRQQQQTQHRHVQVVKETQQFQEHLLNDNANDNKEIKKKNLDHAFVTVTSAVAVITPEPSSTHAYIPFDLDYSDPREEKAARQQNSRQSTINEVLTNLFPKGFSDIFRFSYADNTETTTTTTVPPPITVIRSTPTPFKPMPTTKPKEEQKQNVSSTTQKTETTTTKPKAQEPSKNTTLVTVSTTVTKETRREVSPGHTEIVVEKIITDPSSYKSSEEFKDGSNSISRDELLRINRAAREASVLPSLLINPQGNCSTNATQHKANEPIVILNESNDNIDDFVDAPEDDNQIAETQNVVHQVYQKPPPAESTSFHATQNHQYNVRIIHDDSLRKAQDEELERLESQAQRYSPSYQSFVQQSKYLQNSLQETPSRKFLKNFQHPIMSQDPNPAPVSKGNFHYEHNGAQSHIQTVPPAAQLQYIQYQQQQQPKQQQEEQEQYQHLHTQIIDSQQLSDKDVYQTVESESQETQSATPVNVVFVTINTPTSPTPKTPKQSYIHSHDSLTVPSNNLKSPHEFVSEAIGLKSPQLLDHQTEETENNPKPSSGGYTFVEVQKSINIHNKLITEKDGHLIEQHETIYPEHKYRDRFEPQSIHSEQQHPKQNDYISLSQNPIHVEQLEEQTNHESYEPAASLKEEQHVINPSQDLTVIGPIQQSNLIQESHIIETANQGEIEHQENYAQHVETHPEVDGPYNQQHVVAHVEDPHGEEHLLQEEHHPEEYSHQEELHHPEEPHHPVEHHHPEEHQNLPEPSQDPYQPPVKIPYALPPQEYHHHPQQHHHQQPAVVLQEIIEKHIPMPYAVPEPVGVPIHIEHFIDRPYPVETIVEKPVPYPVEKVVEKVVEKHVPVEVQKVVEKEKIVNKYIDRPVAIPIKIPVALHIPTPQSHSLYGHSSPYHPSSHGGPDYVTPDFATPWSQGGGTLTRIPAKVLQSYYTKMLKKLVPQMQQAYKNSALGSKTKLPAKAHNKQKISDILFDLKPPPARPRGSNWDLGARYQYDYNTLPLDLSASSSMDVGKQYERPGKGYKTNFDEFQRWRNGHNLKRSPDFGRNLHMEYGFKPPLVPSVEIDDKGIPLKAVADLTKGKEE